MGRWSDYQAKRSQHKAERSQRKAGETETGKELIGQRELVWAKLTEAQKGFWESRYHMALTPLRGHLVREDVHHGTHTSGVHS